MLPAKTRRRTRRAECKAFREGTYRRGRERERERGIPETITSLNGLDLSPASSFFSLLLHRGIPVHRFVPVNGGERREREREKKEVGFVGYQGGISGVFASFNYFLSLALIRD